MELDSKTALVTGGAGFIGSALSEQLLRMGCKVVAFDNFDDFYPGKESNVLGAQANPRYSLLRGTILDEGEVDAAVKGADIVFHLAAQPGVRYCLERPEKAHAVNVTGTFNVLQAARKHKVSKFVYASSSSVYGDPIKVPMDEEHPLRPGSPYAASKLAAEKYCLAFAKSYGMKVVCLRYFSVYGPRGRPDQVITSFTVGASRGVPPTIYGDGTNSRDFTYVSDVVDATVLSAMSDEADGETMNVGYGKDVKIGAVAEAVLRHFGSSMKIRYKPGYAGDFSRTICSNKKAQHILGWRPLVGLDEGLRKYFEWFDAQVQKGARAPVEETSRPIHRS